MADLNCMACEEIRQEVPELVTDGFTEEMCASFKNDTGLNPSSGHDDCEDLNNLNDCLIGNMETEIDLYDTCEWKPFTKKFIDNLWTTLKAMICAICGLWTNIHNVWRYAKSYRLTGNGNTITLTAEDGSHGSHTIPEFTPTMNTRTTDGYVEKGQGQANKVWATDENGNPAWRESQATDITELQCLIDKLFEGSPETNFAFGEDSTGDSKLRPGLGVDFKIRTASQAHTSDVTLQYIAGGFGRLYGSFRLFTESFKDVDGNTKSGNSVWNFTASGWTLPQGGELLYEIRIKKSEFPQLRTVFNSALFNSNGYQRLAMGNVVVFNAGSYAYGQHGWCDDDGTPSASGYDSGHLVPDGWLYIQVRLGYVSSWYVSGVEDGVGNTKQGSNMTLSGNVGMRINVSKIEESCE